jgi:predicted transcriptional regulator
MLLSLRLKEKFSETQEIIKEIFVFLQEFNLEQVEMEWLVTSWCKIKRDIWKLSKKNSENKENAEEKIKPKSLTLVNYLDMKNNELKFLYLLEEIRIYNCFKWAFNCCVLDMIINLSTILK